VYGVNVTGFCSVAGDDLRVTELGCSIVLDADRGAEILANHDVTDNTIARDVIPRGEKVDIFL
jgi:hypothetical protein